MKFYDFRSTLKSKVSKPLTISVEIVSFGDNKVDTTKEILNNSDLEVDLSTRKKPPGMMISEYMNTSTAGYSKSKILLSNKVRFQIFRLRYSENENLLHKLNNTFW